MKKLFFFIFLCGHFFISFGQEDPIIHQGTFSKGRFGMSSNHYKPDSWEKSYYDSSLKTVFPLDLIKQPDKYVDKLVHLIGIVDSVYMDSNKNVIFGLENKYWDYVEDYSIQDEKMFISEKGEGRFFVTLSDISREQFEVFEKFPEENKLFLVYGIFKGLANGFPVSFRTLNFGGNVRPIVS